MNQTLDPIALSTALDGLDAVDLASALVRAPSYPGIPRQEEAAVDILAEWLARHGLEPRLDTVLPGRPNLLCTLDSGREGPHLLLCGHTDTVPLNAHDEGFAFSGEVRDGLLLGRGAVDMKGALAAMAAAAVAVYSTRALRAGRLSFAAVIDEEMGGLGIEHLVRQGRVADAAIVGEPSENRILLGHKGLEWLEVQLTGRLAHGGTPDKGLNAIDAAARFLALVRNEIQPRLAESEHPILGPPTLNVGTIAGGDQPSTVAADCRICLDRRTGPGESYESVTSELEALLRRVAEEMPGLGWSVARLEGSAGELERKAFVTASDHPLVRAAVSARRRVSGSPTTFGAFPAWTDGGMLAATGTAVIILGPGELALAHSPREVLPVDQMLEAALLYAATAVTYCSDEAE